MDKKWQFCVKNDELIAEISKKHNISKLLATILINRGVISDEEINVFLHPTRQNFYDPFLLSDMEKSVDRIIDAINKKEKIVIYGDYDVDGITSTIILKKFLKSRNIDVDYYIPNRLEEGYGLSKESVLYLSDNGYSLIITVDCGISAIKEVDVLIETNKNIDIIITDHHEPKEKLPNAFAIINPKRKDNKYPFNQLAGVGVAFKLIQALCIKLNLDEKEYLKYLDFVCVGTISDIVPLVSENRVIAKLGLKLIEQTKNIGLKALIKSTGYANINSIMVSFGIAPRINACGRMGFQEEAVKLFLSENINEATNIAEKLNEFNKERQATEKRIFDEAIEIIKNQEETNSIVIGSENWHHGVIGIVASKITEIYSKPTILVCFEGDIAKGSGRSVLGFNLQKAVSECESSLEKFGGHEMAIGLSLKKENFEKFKKDLEKIVSESKLDEIIQIVKIDDEIDIKNISEKLVQELKLLEPFGEGNANPKLIYKNLKINSIRSLSEGKHLKLSLKDENTALDAIGFGLGKVSQEYLIGDTVDVLGLPEINEFNGRKSIQINLKEIKKSNCQ